jgi:four helix bundle protein
VDISTGIILAMEAEGQAEFSEEIDRAVGVACRLECQLLIARDISLINAHTFAALEARTQEVQKMLVALRASAHRGAAGPARGPVRVTRL